MAGSEILIGLAVSAATSLLTSALTPKTKLLPVDKGRYDDIRIQGSEYGSSIPIVLGRARLAGNIIYSDGVQPHVTTTPGGSGGKFGGGGTTTPPTNTYTYTTNIAVAICAGEIKGGLKRIWENTKVTQNMDASPLPFSITLEAEDSSNTFSGGAVVVRDLAASSEFKVSLPVNGATLTFNDVEAPMIGTHNIIVSYMGLGAKSCQVLIDNVSIGTISFPSTGGDSIVSTKAISHTFADTTGHTVTFKNNTGSPAPYIDAIAVYSSTAIATANLTLGSVSSVDVTFGGSGYDLPPAVTFVGDGEGATGTATVSGGQVTAITVTNGGNGYTFIPEVVIAPSMPIIPDTISGIVDPDSSFPSDRNNPSAYYNARFIPDDVTGTATGLQYNPSQSLDFVPVDGGGGGSGGDDPPGGTGGGGPTSAAFTFYSGSETQLPDPMMESIEGVGNVPAYRGTSYITFRDYQIPNGQMPNFTFEVDEGTHDLGAIVSILWKEVGLEDSQLDVTDITGTYVEGLVIPTRSALSDVLDSLSIAFAFDFVDINGKIVAVKRGSDPVVTITPDELRAYEEGSDIPVADLEGTYVDIDSLPREVDVSYIDRSRDYHQNVQPAITQIGYTKEPQTLTLPLVLSANQAQEVGLRVLNTLLLQRKTIAFSLAPKYSFLSPTDIIEIDMPDVTHKLRVTQLQTGMPGLCKIQAVPDSASLYGDAIAGTPGDGFEPPPIIYPANTELTLMDIQPLFPDQTGYGYYAAASGRGSGNWYGAHLYREEIVDSGNYVRIGGFEVPATQGDVGGTLSSSPIYSDGIDTTSSITVQLFYGGLESYTIDEINSSNSLNLAYIGGEMVQFATAVISGAGVNPYTVKYTLTNFKRGVNGTSDKIDTHDNGERFVLFNNAVKFMREEAASLYLNHRYKAVSIGQPLSGAAVVLFTAGVDSPPPVVTEFDDAVFDNCLTQVSELSPEGIAFIAVRGTFKFGDYVGGQKAKIFIKRPGDSSYNNTGILATPDATNHGAFEIAATVNGTYWFQVVSVSPFDHSLLSGHPEASITVVASAPQPTAPVWQTPPYTFDGQYINWNWIPSSQSIHSYYQIADSSGTLLTDAQRLDANSYSEYPSTSILSRKVRSVSNQGVLGIWSTVQTTSITDVAPPVVSNFGDSSLSSGQHVSLEGITIMYIRGTFNFNTTGFSGAQQAKVYVKRPLTGGGNESTFFDTGIVISKDAGSTAASFEFSPVVNGTYIFQVVSLSQFGHRQASGHPIGTINVTVTTTTPSAPVWATTPAVFDGQNVTWRWNPSSDATHLYYKIYSWNGTSGTLLTDGQRIDANSYTEIPQSTQMRRVITDVNNQGIESAFSVEADFTLTTPSVVTGYSLTYDGYNLIHSWDGNSNYNFTIATANNGTGVLAANLKGNQWIEQNPTPSGRTFTRYILSSWYGVSSISYATQSLSISAPSAPVSVIFDTSRATPFDVPIIIDSSSIADKRLIRTTTIQVLRSSDNSLLNAYSVDGVADGYLVSGRFQSGLSADTTIKVKVFFTDGFGSGSSATTSTSYTFPPVAPSDISDPYILGTSIHDGVINTAAFASGIRPVIIWTATPKPTLPSTSYPVGTLLYWVGSPSGAGDNRTYVNQSVSGVETWVVAAATSFTDLAGTISGSQIGSGTITDSMISSASAFSKILYSNIQNTWSGGGDITWSSSSGLSWTSRFVSIPNALSATGLFEFATTVSPLTITTAGAGLYRRVQVGGTSTAGNTTLISSPWTSATAGYFIIPSTSYNSTLTPTGFVDYLIGFVHPDSPSRFVLWDGRIINDGQTLRAGTSVPVGGIITESILTGAITAAKIQAGSITAEKLAIGMQTGNLAINPSFESQYVVTTGDYYTTNGVSVGTIIPEGWNVLNNNGVSVLASGEGIPTMTAGTDGNYVLKLTSSSTNKVTSKAIPVAAGVTYLLRARAYGVGTTAFTMTVVEGTAVDAHGYTTQTSVTTLDVGTINVGGTWGEYGTPRQTLDYYTVPTGKTYISLQFTNTSGTVYVDDIVVTRQFGSTYIQNGAITADLLSAYAVRAQNIQVGTFSESLQLNPRFVDGMNGYFDVNGVQVTTTSGFSSPSFSSSIPSEWVGTSVPTLQLPAITNQKVYGNWIPLDVNDTYYIELWIRSSSTTNVLVGLHTDLGDNSGEGRFFYISTIGTTWTKVHGVVGKTGSVTDTTYRSWSDYSSNGGGAANINSSTKFRVEVIANNGSGTATVNIAQVSIARMQTGNLIVNGAITALQIQANSITADRLLANSITAGQIQVGAIGADQLAANSIRADKLAVGVLTNNLISNSSFEDFNSATNVPNGWSIVEGSGIVTSSTGVTASDGNYSAAIPTVCGIGSQAIPVVAGDIYVINFKLRTTATTGIYYARMEELNSALTTGTTYIGSTGTSINSLRSSTTDLINTYNGANESLSAANLSTLGTSTWIQKQCIYTVPAGVKYVSFAVLNWTSSNGTLYLDSVDFRKQISGVTIQDGTVSALKILANSITSTQIAANTITALNLVVGGMSDNLLSNPSFQTIDPVTSFPLTWATYNTASSSAVAVAGNGVDNYYARLKDANRGITSRVMSVEPGNKVAISFRAQSTGAGGAGFGTISILFKSSMPSSGTDTQKYYIGTGGDGTSASEVSDYLKQSGTESTLSPISLYNNFQFASTWSYYEGVIIVPDNMYWMSFSAIQTVAGVNRTLNIDDIIVRVQVGAAFISNLRADQLVANTGDIGLIFADQIKQKNYVSYQVGSTHTLNTSAWTSNNSGNLSYNSITDSITYIGVANNADTGYLSQSFQTIAASTSSTAIDGSISLVYVSNSGGADCYFGLAPSTYTASSGMNNKIAYGWRLATGNFAYIIEGQDFSFSCNITSLFVNNALALPYSAGDTFSVNIENRYVRYYKNGRLVWTSPYLVSSTRSGCVYPAFKGCVAFYGIANFVVKGVALQQNGVGQGWRLNPLAGNTVYNQEPIWTLPIGSVTSLISGVPLSPNDPNAGTILTKANNGVFSWDSSVVSDQNIASGDGWIQTGTNVYTGNHQEAFGLTNQTNGLYTAPDISTLQYGIYYDGANLRVIENNSIKTTITHGSGDVFRVSIEGGVAKYRKNGAVFYTSLTTPLNYPFKAKACFNRPYQGDSDGMSSFVFNASSSGAGEFNSGVSVKGENLEDTVILAKTSLRQDYRYRGNDRDIPFNQVTSIYHDSYKADFEDDYVHVNLAIHVTDYNTNIARQMDSLKHAKVRVWNKFGQRVSDASGNSIEGYVAWHGRGIGYSGSFLRTFADPKQEATYSIEFENVFGFSQTLWYSEAGWKSTGGRSWTSVDSIHTNLSYTPPQWLLANTCPTNCAATFVQNTNGFSVQVTWTPSASNPITSHTVYYRLFKPQGYYATDSAGGWTSVGTSTTGKFNVIELSNNVRYEFMVANTSSYTDCWSNIAYLRTSPQMSTISGFDFNGPTGVLGTSSSGSGLNSRTNTLTWTNNFGGTGGGTSYGTNIYWAIGQTAVPNTGSSVINIVSTSTASYNHTGLPDGTWYAYRLSHVYDAGGDESDLSPVLYVKTYTQPPDNTTPYNTVGIALGFYGAGISWNSVSLPSSFTVQVDYSGGSWAAPVVNRGTTSSETTNRGISVSGLTAGTEYQVRVSSSSAPTVWSNVAYFTTESSWNDRGCVSLDTDIKVINAQDEDYTEQATNITVGMRVIGLDLQTKEYVIAAVKHVDRKIAPELLTIVTADGNLLRCSPTHPLINGYGDIHGTAANALNIGDTLIMYNEDTKTFYESNIVSIVGDGVLAEVIFYTLDSKDHTFVSNNFVSHNLKPFNTT